MRTLCILGILTFSCVLVECVPNGTYWPVVIVPGTAGSRLEAKLNKTNVVDGVCAKTTKDFYLLWLNPLNLLPGAIQCWVDNARLQYDLMTGTTSNAPGVEIRVPGFGNTTGVEVLSNYGYLVGSYFKDMVTSLKAVGYVPGKSIRAAPYDFRKAANEQDEYFTSFKFLIEETYQINNRRKIVLVAHSMGSIMMQYFLNRQSVSWKTKYIKSLVTLAGVWGGSAKSLKAVAVGDSFGSMFLNGDYMKNVERTMPSTAWLFPRYKFWNSSEVLVSTPKKNYTVNDYKALFKEMNYTVGYYMWKDTVKLNQGFRSPGVELHCLYSNGVPTAEKLIYGDDPAHSLPNGSPFSIVTGDGDGSVNIRSLKGCLYWRKEKYPLHHRLFPNIEHMSIVSNSDVIRYVQKVATTA